MGWRKELLSNVMFHTADLAESIHKIRRVALMLFQKMKPLLQQPIIIFKIRKKRKSWQLKPVVTRKAHLAFISWKILQEMAHTRRTLPEAENCLAVDGTLMTLCCFFSPSHSIFICYFSLSRDTSTCPSGRTKPCNWLLPHLSPW